MYLKLTLLALLFLGWSNTAILFLVVNLTVSNFGKRIFAGFCAKMVDNYNKVSNPMKTELFKELNDMRKGEKISILEVGAGPGANFKYFTRDAIQSSHEIHVSAMIFHNSILWSFYGPSHVEIAAVKYHGITE